MKTGTVCIGGIDQSFHNRQSVYQFLGGGIHVVNAAHTVDNLGVRVGGGHGSVVLKWWRLERFRVVVLRVRFQFVLFFFFLPVGVFDLAFLFVAALVLRGETAAAVAVAAVAAAALV